MENDRGLMLSSSTSLKRTVSDSSSKLLIAMALALRVGLKVGGEEVGAAV